MEGSDSRSHDFAKELMIILVAVVAALLSITLLGEQSRILLGREHGILESLHSVLCLLSGLLFFDAYRRSTGAVRVAGGAMAMVSFAGFVRELELKSLAGPGWYEWIAHHGLQEILFVAMAAPALVYVVVQRRYFLDLLALALRREAIALHLGAAFLLVGIYLDERVVDGPASRFWEEFVETIGYTFLTIAAVRHRRLAAVGVESGLPARP